MRRLTCLWWLLYRPGCRLQLTCRRLKVILRAIGHTNPAEVWWRRRQRVLTHGAFFDPWRVSCSSICHIPLVNVSSLGQNLHLRLIMLTILTHDCCRMMLILYLSWSFLTMASTWLPSLELSLPFHHTIWIERTIGLFESFLIFDLMTVIVVRIVPTYCLLIVTTFGLMASEGWLQSNSSPTACIKTRTANILLLTSDWRWCCLYMWSVWW